MLANTTVAFLDILGFKQLIDTRLLSDLSLEYENETDLAKRLVFPAEYQSVAATVPKLFSSHDPSTPLCALHVFSDSLILIANGSDAESCLKLLICVWRISQTFLVAGFPLRGGIAFGEMYCNSHKSIILGKALTDAHSLEKEQDWVGISIDNSVLQQFPNLRIAFSDQQNVLSHIFMKYPVPFKSVAPKVLHTVNWRAHLVVHAGTRSLFSPSDTASMTKIKNTLEYAKAVVQVGAYARDYEQVPLECRLFYVGPVEPPFPHGDDY